MVAHQQTVVRRLSDGKRAQEVRFGRFLGNDKVTVDRLIEGWGEQTRSAVCGRHVLALQDTSEIKFTTTARHQRGLGEIGKGNSRGVLLHAMLALDATTQSCLGLVTGQVWTREGRVSIPHEKRQLKDKESNRWLTTPEQAKDVLAEAAMVTVIDDREGDIYAKWAWLPGPNFHLITRVMHDRALADGGSLYCLGASLHGADTRVVTLPARNPQRPARDAKLTLRFTPLQIRRPKDTVEKNLPKSVALSLVEVVELDPPPDVEEPVYWRLLTTHTVTTVADAWQIVHWYMARWIIEQLFRVMKSQGLNIEDSQLESADRLLKLVAIAAKVAAVTIQLNQARDGKDDQPASLVFNDDEINALIALDNRYKGSTKQTNPHRYRSLAWAAWIIARLGGWDGYPRSKKPGPITFRNGLQRFQSIALGWTLGNVCIP